jgi:hypothetical protein
MNHSNARRLNATLPPTALVIDVGGGASVFPRADHVIDLCPYAVRNALGELNDIPTRYSSETWVQKDLCDRTPWPYPDKFFDFATCSHVFEDVRDPIWLCSEISRIAKAGYVETPSRALEQSRGVENPTYAGYCHHRWLISREGETLKFRHKPHSLHTLKDAIVTELGPNQRIAPKHEIFVYEWKDELRAEEVTEIFSYEELEKEMSAVAAQARSIPDLTESKGLSGLPLLKRWLYWRRLQRGAR